MRNSGAWLWAFIWACFVFGVMWAVSTSQTMKVTYAAILGGLLSYTLELLANRERRPKMKRGPSDRCSREYTAHRGTEFAKWIGSLLPRKHRQATMGDIYEDVHDWAEEGYTLGQIRRRVVWMFFLEAMGRLKPWRWAIFVAIGSRIMKTVDRWIAG